MRVHVSRATCEGHGVCEQVGPDVYQLDDEGELVILHEESLPAELQDQARAGARSCPVAALVVR